MAADLHRPHALVTGGAGFLGSHLVTSLLADDYSVTVLDDLSSGDLQNLAHLDGAQVQFIEANVQDVSAVLRCESRLADIDEIYHLASPASPIDFQQRRLSTLWTGSVGTGNVLELARRSGARMILASTSEIYGDPMTHPQSESYWGNVNPIGPRSCYNEAKRFAEALCVAHHHELGTDVGIVRIFNTYGPRLAPGDGRVVSNFLVQAARGIPLTVYGDGSQTRSFCYVDDLIRGMRRVAESGLQATPVNLGNPEEITIADLAELVIEITGSESPIEHEPLPVDDPVRRRPDISRATDELGWGPKVSLRDGLVHTARWIAGVMTNA